jgi:hypothetical protein
MAEMNNSSKSNSTTNESQAFIQGQEQASRCQVSRGCTMIF